MPSDGVRGLRHPAPASPAASSTSASRFPHRGNISSIVWKIPKNFFHCVEKNGIFFHTVENR